ncbi:MAG: M61 family peptidase [Pseudarcicella sp.]|nr:M61 family peptidase [Pseudarcicella sp.]
MKLPSITYKVTVDNFEQHIVLLEVCVRDLHESFVEFQLPAWRPGRYELQNFAKNVLDVQAVGTISNNLLIQKKTKDLWFVEKDKSEDIIVSFRYYANLINAGSSYVDKSVCYFNFVNFAPYIVGFQEFDCELILSLPKDFKLACGLTFQKISSSNYSEYKSISTWSRIVDSPLLASASLFCKTYSVDKSVFYVWFLGDYIPDWEKLLTDFRSFTQFQIDHIGAFPEADYHFINLILPVPHYHGVEHRNSTMIVMGPDKNHQQYDGKGLYQEILGISSHELFHAWNICKVRPKELLPYDFSKENYFNTGFVVEGITTYLGDLFLVHSGVFTVDEYLKELETTVRRHLENDDSASLSLLDSSFDLWLDGYSQAVPNRRVSIYQKGALVALMLDLKIRSKFDHQRSIYTVMKQMVLRFGDLKSGYTYADFIQIAEQVYEEDLILFFDKFVAGSFPILDDLKKCFAVIGIQLQLNEEQRFSLQVLDSNHSELIKWLNVKS